MRWRISVAAFIALVSFVCAPSAALAGSGTQTFLLVMEQPNTGEAANGDVAAVIGEGEFSIHPKSVEAEGTFTHTDSAGNVLVTGSWTATRLLTYQSYGCGVVFGTPIPPDLCGGKVRMRVVLTPDGTDLQIPAVLTVFCVIGDKRPTSVEEGIRLVVPGHVNFNEATGGENVYIRIG